MTSPEIHHLDPETFDEFIQSNEVVYLHFWHENCVPCIKMVTPALENILSKESYPQEVKIAKLNIVRYSEFAQPFGVQGVPSYCFYIRGNYSGTKLGFITGISRPIQFLTYLYHNQKRALELGVFKLLQLFDSGELGISEING